MAARTLAEAEATLANLSGLSDNERRQYEAEVTAAKAQATAQGTTAATQMAQQVREDRDDLLRELCEVRDGLAAARTSADAQVLKHLRQRRERLVRQVEEIERLAERVEEIEEDPTAYGEALYEKYPGTRPIFTF